MAAQGGGAISRKAGALSGAAPAPGDKSISHRALIFGALARGTSRITGLLEGDDVLRTAAAMRALGAEVERAGGVWQVDGALWRTPDQVLYFANSGTGARLVMGAVAGAGIGAAFAGDASLCGRPMGRVLEPLGMMGVAAKSHGGRLPVEIVAGADLTAVKCALAKPSAQVKSAILLAALGANGVTQIHEPVLCRDHTERMLAAFGVKLGIKDDGEAGRILSLAGGQTLTSTDVNVPGDPSSAAFLAAAALITPGSEITIANVLVNPLRAGFYQTVREMGGDISFENERTESGEPVADIRVRHSVLHGIETPAARAPSMIDEYPILAIVAAYAHGETMMRGLEELRVKESDRIASVEAGLAACGVEVASGEDWLLVRGQGQPPKGGALVKTNHDHRIAMSFLTMGLASNEPVEIDDASMVATSFPEFFQIMSRLGGEIITRQ